MYLSIASCLVDAAAGPVGAVSNLQLIMLPLTEPSNSCIASTRICLRPVRTLCTSLALKCLAHHVALMKAQHGHWA